jgi:hypothetical protein
MSQYSTPPRLSQLAAAAILACIVTWTASAPQASAKPGEPQFEQRHVVYIEPLAMSTIGSFFETLVLSLGYEHKLGQGPFAVLLNLHGGYEERKEYDDFVDRDYAYGLGVGLRRYIGSAFEGSYILGQTDYVYGGSRNSYYEYYPTTGSTPYTTDEKHQYLSLTQVGIGYKWMWTYFALDLSLGGAFFMSTEEKYTRLTVGFNLGAPF